MLLAVAGNWFHSLKLQYAGQKRGAVAFSNRAMIKKSILRQAKVPGSNSNKLFKDEDITRSVAFSLVMQNSNTTNN